MKLVFSDHAWEDYLHWQKHDRRLVERINRLLRDIEREPFAGRAKPERLMPVLSGWWSQRLTSDDRIVYRVEGDELQIAQLRFHY